MALENVVYGKTLQKFYEIFSDKTIHYLLKNAENVDWRKLGDVYDVWSECPDPIRGWFDEIERLKKENEESPSEAHLMEYCNIVEDISSLLCAMGYHSGKPEKVKEEIEFAIENFDKPLTSDYISFMQLCEEREDLRVIGENLRWMPLLEEVNSAILVGEGLKRRKFDKMVGERTIDVALPKTARFLDVLFGAGHEYEEEILKDKEFGFLYAEFRNQYFKKEL